MGISSGGYGIVAGKGKTATAKLAEEEQAVGRRRLRAAIRG